MEFRDKVAALKGPILILGGSGFIGNNLLRTILSVRSDTYATFFSGSSWRLKDLPSSNIIHLNLEDQLSVRALLRRLAPQTIFDCSSFGAYSFEQDYSRIHQTNFICFVNLVEELAASGFSALIHAGSSSEYGLNCTAPLEQDQLLPNSHYALSKCAANSAITYFGKTRGLPVVNLRLYSVYGPYEDSSRLIPVLCESSLRNSLPPLAPHASRDFVYVDDVAQAFIDTANMISPAIYGESFNIGSGVPTTLEDLAALAIECFGLTTKPQFNTAVARQWDTIDWYASPQKAQQILHWKANTSLREGLIKTQLWWKKYIEESDFSQLTKKKSTRACKTSVTAIVACYKDAKAIPVMHRRLQHVFEKLSIDYEIIFVNDNSPDDSAEVIRYLSASDPRVLGISHSRNFGSQAAFRSGMEVAAKESVVLLDGDLQDPPELIESFVHCWREGAEVVYGRRIRREMPRYAEFFYRMFYQLFSFLSEVPMPRDAGDFSLLDRRVVYWLLQCNERDSFLRGLRAYVGFRQVGVDYIRPERMFGVSTNNWIKNVGWAKKAIFSFSRLPLHLLSAIGACSVLLSLLLSLYSIVVKLLSPASVPQGFTFLTLLVMVFGSAVLLSLGLLGEYIGKILEEVKRRPAFIRSSIITNGMIRPTRPDL